MTARYSYAAAVTKSRYRPTQDMLIPVTWFSLALQELSLSYPSERNSALNNRNKLEDEELLKRLKKEPLPKSRNKMKAHAMYVIKPDLRKNEAK